MPVERVDEAFVELLQANVADVPCPECGDVGLVIRERYVARPLAQILQAAQTYGPHGLPLVIWCPACGSGGRVAKFTDRRPGPPA